MELALKHDSRLWRLALARDVCQGGGGGGGGGLLPGHHRTWWPWTRVMPSRMRMLRSSGNSPKRVGKVLCW